MSRFRTNGQRVRELRAEKGLTQSELADRVGYSVKTIWKVEAGGKLKRQTLGHLAEALGIEWTGLILAAPSDPRPSDEPHPRAVVLDLLEAVQQRDVEAIGRLLVPEVVLTVPKMDPRSQARHIRGREHVVEWFRAQLEEWPALRIEVRRVVSEGDCADAHLRLTDNQLHSNFTLAVCAACQVSQDRVSANEVFVGP